MDCSMPGLPVHHQLPEFTQTHVHWVGDAIQPSHPLLPLLLLSSIFPSIRIFSNEMALPIRWPKYWSLSFSISPSNEYSGLISFRIDWFDLLADQGTLKFSTLPQFESISSSALSLLYWEPQFSFTCNKVDIWFSDFQVGFWFKIWRFDLLILLETSKPPESVHSVAPSGKSHG